MYLCKVLLFFGLTYPPKTNRVSSTGKAINVSSEAKPMYSALPPKQGLYDPQFEHDSCGVGFVVDIKGRKSHRIVRQALNILLNLRHRGACGCEANTGDGAGILLQTPHAFLKEACAQVKIPLPSPREY